MKLHYLLYALQTVGATVLAAWMVLRWDRLFPRLPQGRGRDLLRVIGLTIVFYTAFMPGNLGWTQMDGFYARPAYVAGAYVYVSLVALLTYTAHALLQGLSFYRARPALSFAVIALCPFALDLVGQHLVGFRGEKYLNNVSYSLLIGCCAGMVHLFFRFYSHKTAVRISELTHLKTQAELELLQSKINPHFLYNALSGLAGLALEDGRKASRMATSLSHMFRYSLNKEQEPIALVADELEMTETYLDIEKIRFEERLEVQLQVDDASLGQRLPRFLLQPLVENAIKHGFRHMSGPGVIGLRISGANPLMVEVADNGQPFPDELQQGYGLDSIRNKLDLLFPGKHRLELHNEPYKAVRVTVWQ